MNTDKLMEALLARRDDVPAKADVIELTTVAVEEQERRLRKLLELGRDACGRALDRAQWRTEGATTVVSLTQGARAVLHHASGAFRLTSGRAPMDVLFKHDEPNDQLMALTERWLDGFALRSGLGRGESLRFERMWRVKACAADRDGRKVEPVLCRAVGAYRHHVHDIAVLGAASVAVQVAGDGAFDMLAVQMRQPGAGKLASAAVMPPERAARAVVQRLQARFEPGERTEDVRLDAPAGLRFGYFSAGKRKPQRLLAPVYMATIDLVHDKLRQGMVLLVPATERDYLELDPPGQHPPAVRTAKAHARLAA